MNNENAVGALWLGGYHNIVIRKNEVGQFINSKDEVKDWIHLKKNKYWLCFYKGDKKKNG